MAGSAVHDEHPIIDQGEFPYPILEPGCEPRQLVHLRNNANYMATNGLFDYLRLVSNLGRGVIVNLLVVLPYLLVMALGVAWLSIVEWRFGVAFWLVVLVLVWALISPIVVRLWQVWRIPQTMVRGTDSSIRTRDLYERSFGFLLLILGVVTLGEALAYSLDNFHFWTRERGLGLTELASGATVALGVLASAGRVLPKLGGARRTLAILFVGLLGVILPIFAVLFIADYLVFTGPGRGAAILIIGAGVAFWIVVFLALVIGSYGQSLTRRFKILALSFLALSGALLVVAVAQNDEIFVNRGELQTSLRELGISEDARPRAAASTVPEEIAARQLEYRQLADDVAGRNPTELRDLQKFLVGDVSEQSPVDTDESATVSDEEVVFGGKVALPGVLQLRQLLADNEIAWQDGSGTTTAAEAKQLHTSLLVLEDLFPGEVPEGEEEREKRTRLMLAALQAKYRLNSNATALELHSDTSLAAELPRLGVRYGDTLEQVEVDLRAMSTLLLDLRAEAAESVIFSTKFPLLRTEGQSTRLDVYRSSVVFALAAAILLWVYGWITIDPNRTSLHGLYRDRLATAFLVARDPAAPDEIRIEPDLDLAELSRYEAGSSAPYHLINCAVNLQATSTMNIRDRQSDFFIFSKRFTGSRVTGYCRSETMEAVYPDMSLSTAMAISAAAAAPNMGRSTKPALTAFMVMLNARLGAWVPNPGKVEAWANSDERAKEFGRCFELEEVLASEKFDVQLRWGQYDAGRGRSIEGGMFGVAYSGGGIRSASLNLGITQVLHAAGVFQHIDYMSTVSGGGYLGSAISLGMRSSKPVRSSVDGTVSVGDPVDDIRTVTITPDGEGEAVSIDYPAVAELAVESNDQVVEGQLLLKTGRVLPVLERLAEQTRKGSQTLTKEQRLKGVRRGAFGVQYHWRVRPSALLCELVSRTHEESRWVNVSDGGHIENLAVIELLRRRCKFIIAGDAEMDAAHNFTSFAIMKRTASVELGVDIEINLDALRLDEHGYCERHWAIGRIHYTNGEVGYLLYFKSSLTKDEPEDIRAYKANIPLFPHESTADQFFDEGQFEAYRHLGQHMAHDAIASLNIADEDSGHASFDEVATWLEHLWTAAAGDV